MDLYRVFWRPVGSRTANKTDSVARKVVQISSNIYSISTNIYGIIY